MAVYAFSGLKGGVGKTTAALGCAVEWHRRGRKVLVVDADSQQTALMWSLVATEQAKPCPTMIYMNATMHHPDQLPRLAQNFDVVIIDTPPRLQGETRSALMVADVVVLPCGPSTHDTWALSPSVDLANEAQLIRPTLIPRILVTRKAANTVIGREVRNVLKNAGVPLLATELCYRIDYQEASAAGLGPTTYRPSSAASLEIRNLVNELDEITETPLQKRARKEL